MSCGGGCDWPASFARCLKSIFRAAGLGESVGGWGRSGKSLMPLLGRPSAFGVRGMLLVSPEPFPCQAFRSLGLLGFGGLLLPLRWRLCSCALPFPCLSAFFFLLPGFSAGCASGLGSWLLPLASPPRWIPSFGFSGGGRRVWLLAAGRLFGVVLVLTHARVFLYKVIKGYRRRKSAISLYF